MEGGYQPFKQEDNWPVLLYHTDYHYF
jgi:hypothetical protein